MIDWRWKPFSEFTLTELYDVLAARQAVFVIEQQCLYDDLDGLDAQAWHLCGYECGHNARQASPNLAAYLRVLLPEGAGAVGEAGKADEVGKAGAAAKVDEDAEGCAEIRIGRVLTSPAYRGTGLGKQLFARGLHQIGMQWPGVALRLHAQAHLQAFYGGFGFEPASAVHDEDGIAHIWMRRGPL